MINFKYINFISAIIVICSCTTRSPYPNGWPEIDETPDQNCSELEGTYENFNGDNYLSELFGIEGVPLIEWQNLEITFIDDNTMELTISEDSKEIATFKILNGKNGYYCEKGTINLIGYNQYFFNPMVIATSYAEIKLDDAEDDSLIAHVKHKSYSLGFMILPITVNNIVWEKWEKAN